ncbi:hypothetical protein [Lacisediminimonas profundi]|uniref:hypothetical protein n=1 Tax=Lacisediminimonas profundi TaxID=2603856 RepID=UPI00124B9B55|nr:hypothetical protein [Lacisediminimonas profundi]
MNPLPLLLPSLSARPDSQRHVGDSVQQGMAAWRKALEQEQQSALRRFRSVPAPDSSAAPADIRPSLSGTVETASGAAGIFEALRQPGVAQATAGPAGSSAASAPASAASQLASQRASQPYSRPDLRSHVELNSQPHSQPQPASAAAATTAAAQAATTGPAMPATAQALIGIDVSAAAPTLATSIPWPSRNLHFVRVDDGMQVWLRDSTLAGDGRALAQCIADLRQVLAGLGLRLAGFTLNGLHIPLT